MASLDAKGSCLPCEQTGAEMKYFNPGAVVLIGYAVYASDDCAAVAESRRSPVECYNCVSTKSPGCDDAFNVSDPTIETVICEGPCAKWVRRPKYGPHSIQRACSRDLTINLHISLVCMTESRPGDGVLCFCHDDLCNSSTSAHGGGIFSRLWAYLFMSCIALLLGNAWWRCPSSSGYQSQDYCMQIYVNHHCRSDTDFTLRPSKECGLVTGDQTDSFERHRDSVTKSKGNSSLQRRCSMITNEIYRTRIRDRVTEPSGVTLHLKGSKSNVA